MPTLSPSHDNLNLYYLKLCLNPIREHPTSNHDLSTITPPHMEAYVSQT